MSDSPSNPHSPLETLVRADLDRRADAVDPRAVFDRIKRSTGHRGNALPLRLSFGRRVVRWASGISAAAAAVLICILLGSQGAAPAQASPESILQEARRQLQVPRDRCYLVEVRKSQALLDLERDNPVAQQSRMTLLWTRGDRYVLTPINAPQPFAWGRGKAGDFWLALGPKRALQFPANDAPPWLLLNAEVLSMRVDRLLDDVLRDFDLVREGLADGQPATTIVIRATLKPNHWHPALHSARIEFDDVTKVVRKLVLERTRGRELMATVTYLLVDSETREDRSYELEGHLDADHEIFSRYNEQARGIMAQFFGRAMGLPAPGRPLNPIGPRPPGMRPLLQPMGSGSRPATQPAARDGL